MRPRRVIRQRPSGKADGEPAVEFVELAPGELRGVFTAPSWLRDLGMMYLQMGDEAKARIVLERSVGLDASDADTHFQLSRLYNLTGERELARKHLEIFQKLRNGQGNSSQ